MTFFKKYKTDIIVLAGIAAVGIILLAVVLLAKKPGTTVVVSVSGTVMKTFPLSADTRYTITGKDGGTNVLVIQDGYAWVEEASCPDGLCVNMGKINVTGQSVICLPNEVVVSIRADGEDEFDTVVQ